MLGSMIVSSASGVFLMRPEGQIHGGEVNKERLESQTKFT